MREVVVSLAIGWAMALAVVAGGWGITGQWKLGLAVGLATLALIMLATTMGALIPMFFKWVNVDPALATGPFITTMNDILGILVYLGVALLVLG